MRKPFSFDQRSKTVFCSNPHCAKIRGAEGVARAAIKENVVARHAPGTPIPCYDCAIYFRTGKNRHQRKAASVARRVRRTLLAQEAALKARAVAA